MRLVLAYIVAALISIGCYGGVRSINTNPTRVIDRASASVLRINGIEDGLSYTCTGFVVAPQLVLTAEHCIGEKMLADGQPVTVLRESEKKTDLALLAVPTTKQPLILRESDLKRFDVVHGIGYAMGMDYLTVSFSRVNAVNRSPDRDDMLPGLIVMPGYMGGMSGGPVIDEDGLVVGMCQQSNKGVGYGVGTLIMRAFLVGL